MSSIDRFSRQYDYQNVFEADQNSKRVFVPPTGFNINLPQQHKFSSAYFKDHIDQEYIIHRAFNANNFTYLRNLPDNFKRGEILNDRKQKVVKQTELQTISRSKAYEQKLLERQIKINENKKQKIGTLGYFTKFQYVQSNYQIPKILQSIQRKQSQKKRNQISELDFRPSGVEVKMKYEDPFQYLDKTLPNESFKQNNNYLFPFHLAEDTYDEFMESQKRRKLISDSMKLHGDFIPAKNERILTKPNKQLIGQIIRQIQLLLKKYLKQLGFFIGVTKDDYIEVLFENNQSNMNRISMFMSKICEHETICRYILRRNLAKWGEIDKEKGYLVYCILPSWVRNPAQSLEKQ